MRKDRGVVSLLVLTVLAAAVVTAQEPQNPGGGATTAKESGCYECHAQGGGSFGPPLRALVTLTPLSNQSFVPGEPTPYTVRINNAWTAEVYDIVAWIDTEDAPSFGFSPGQDAIHESQEASISTTPTTGERRVEVTFQVPVGATAMRIVLAPDTRDGLLAPDLTLRAWAPGKSITGPPTRSMDLAGAGGREVVHIEGGKLLAGLGFGEWTFQATQRVDATDLSSVQEQDMTFTLAAWSNTTGETVQYLSTDARFDGQEPLTRQSTTITWNLLLVQPPDNETLRIGVEATGHYDHPGTTSGGLDTWRFSNSLDVRFTTPVATETNGTTVTGEVVSGSSEGQVAPVDAVFVPWDQIGEIIGYIPAFLILVSMVSGGVFGKASRRGMNRLFRSARRRVAFHNLLSYTITLFALAHTVVFLVEPGFRWTLGLIWGGSALLAMLLLGATGFLQVPMIRALDFSTWRWTHLLLAIATLLLTVVHMLLDGIHFVEVAEAVGWNDPLL